VYRLFLSGRGPRNSTRCAAQHLIALTSPMHSPHWQLHHSRCWFVIVKPKPEWFLWFTHCLSFLFVVVLSPCQCSPFRTLSCATLPRTAMSQALHCLTSPNPSKLCRVPPCCAMSHRTELCLTMSALPCLCRVSSHLTSPCLPCLAVPPPIHALPCPASPVPFTPCLPNLAAAAPAHPYYA